MIDMKTTPKAKEGGTMLCPEVCQSDEPEYPWGLRISLDEESLKKLGIADLPAIDQDFKLTALCCVVSVSSHESQNNGASRTLDLQIEMMELTPANEESGERNDMAQRMFGGK